MLSTLSEATVVLFKKQTDEGQQKTLTVLATFANITKCMLEKEEFCTKLSPETQLLCEQVSSLFLEMLHFFKIFEYFSSGEMAALLISSVSELYSLKNILYSQLYSI